MRVLKHCTTRWFSLERAVKCLIAMWTSLHVYFDLEKERDCRNEHAKRVASSLCSSCMFTLFSVLYALLRASVLCFRLELARFPQCKVIIILDLLRSYLSNFIQASVLRSTDDVTMVAYDDFTSSLSNEELGVGTSTLLLLSEFQEDTPVEIRL